MTHKSSIIPASAALLLTLLGTAGCSKQQAVQSPAQGNFPADHVIRVAPQVAATKGSYTADNLTKFDLLVEDSNNPKYTYSNTVFEKGESGWTSDSLLLWSKSDAEVLVYAIAPSVGTEGSVSVSAVNGDGASLEVQAEQSKDDFSSDFLGWASGQKKVDDLLGTDGKLSFAFTHLLTRFTVTFKLGTEFNVSGVPQQDILSDVVISGTAKGSRLRVYIVLHRARHCGFRCESLQR